MIWIRDKWDKVTLSSTQKIDIKIHNRRCWVSRLFSVAWKPIFELKGSGQCYVSLPGRKAQSQANIVVVSISPLKYYVNLMCLPMVPWLWVSVRSAILPPGSRVFLVRTWQILELNWISLKLFLPPAHVTAWGLVFFFFKFYLIWGCARWHVGS